MRLMRCDNGHFYDADKFDFCPWCDSEMTTEDIIGMTDAGKGSLPMHSREVKLSVNENTILESRVTKVVLYPDSAKVTQEVTYIPKKSREKIYIVDFPAAVELDHIHISANKGLHCMAISKISSKMYDEFPELQADERKLKKLISQKKFLKKKKQSLHKYMSKCSARVQTIQELAETYQQTEAKNAEFIETEQQLKDEISQLKKKIGKQREKKNKVVDGLELDICAETGREYTLSIEYKTGSAYWIPLYDVQSFSNSNQVSFILKAKIFQNAGIDWNNVFLTFSTGTKNNMNITDLEPYKITKKPQILQEMLPLPPSTGQTQYLEDNDVESTFYPHETDTTSDIYERKPPVRIAETGSMHKDFSGSLKREFVMEEPYTIYSNSETSFVINRIDREIEKVFFAVPEKERNEYMGIHIKELLNMNLLSCSANIFLDGAYVGTKNIDSEKSEGIFVLGQAKGVCVTKKLAHEETALITNGIAGITGMIKLHKRYEITVKSQLETEGRLQIIDRIPVTDETDVKIEDIKLGQAELDEKTGYCYWNLVLGAKEEKVITMEYTIYLHPEEDYEY